MRNGKYALAGTADQVKREIEALHRVGDRRTGVVWLVLRPGIYLLRRRDAPDGAVRQAHHSGVPLVLSVIACIERSQQAFDSQSGHARELRPYAVRRSEPERMIEHRKRAGEPNG